MTGYGRDLINDLNGLLYEARLVGVDLNVDRRSFDVTFGIWRFLDDEAGAPADPRLLISLQPIGRIAVSWRRASWNDESAPAEPLHPDELAARIAGFWQEAVYSKIIDGDPNRFDQGLQRLSMDLDLGVAREHTMDLFQEGDPDFIELRVWFDNLTLYRQMHGRLVELSLDDVASMARAAWTRPAPVIQTMNLLDPLVHP
jgi:hypothetical protein